MIKKYKETYNDITAEGSVEVIEKYKTVKGTNGFTHDDYVKSVLYYFVIGKVNGKERFNQSTPSEPNVLDLVSKAEQVVRDGLKYALAPKKETYKNKLEKIGFTNE